MTASPQSTPPCGVLSPVLKHADQVPPSPQSTFPPPSTSNTDHKAHKPTSPTTRNSSSTPRQKTGNSTAHITTHADTHPTTESSTSSDRSTSTHRPNTGSTESSTPSSPTSSIRVHPASSSWCRRCSTTTRIHRS